MSITASAPTEYFDKIYYNPSFYTENNNISLQYSTANYLSRVGIANSVATSTTFSGNVNINNGLNVLGNETVDNINATSSISVSGININTIYQTISAMSNYVTNSALTSTLSLYLTLSSAASIYQTISGMSVYLTSSSAASIYQTISGMSVYLTSSSAASIYQTISGMSSYASLAAANVFTGTSNTFNNFIKIMDISISSASLTNNIIIGKVGSSLPITATSTYDNTILANNSLLSANTANNNVSIGNYSLNSAVNASNNVSVGVLSLSNNVNSNNNSAVGYGALRLSSGSNNCALGSHSIYNASSGSNNSSIGYNSFNTNAYPGGSTISNSTAIGYNANPYNSNQIMLGTTSETVYSAGPININGIDMSTIFLGYNNFTLSSINNNIYYN